MIEETEVDETLKIGSARSSLSEDGHDTDRRPDTINEGATSDVIDSSTNVSGRELGRSQLSTRHAERISKTENTITGSGFRYHKSPSTSMYITISIDQITSAS